VLIFVDEDVDGGGGGGGGGFCEEAFRLSDKSKMKIYSYLLGGKLCESHVSYKTIAL
jgi:hypothetical protein